MYFVWKYLNKLLLLLLSSIFERSIDYAGKTWLRLLYLLNKNEYK